MATDMFLAFKTDSGPSIKGESQTTVTYKGVTYQDLLEPSSIAFGVSNPTTIGSTTGGAGAGKAKFDQFTITKKVDKASAAFFQYAAGGLHLPEVDLFMRKAGGTAGAGVIYLVYRFGLVFVTAVAWSDSSGDDAPTEEVTLVFGSLQVAYTPQNTDGTLNTSDTQTASWSQVVNQATFQTK
jgi:type VI secretion system secreted protein Hcp